jgi:hypothetical protein
VIAGTFFLSCQLTTSKCKLINNLGILTYLKGSGLPQRIHYYEILWKTLREHIEQRERDFSRSDCTLDVNIVVNDIEAKYNQVKADIQANTPDNYVSVHEARNRTAMALHLPSTSAEPSSVLSSTQKKLQEMELKFGPKVHDLLDSLARKEEERLRRIEHDIIATTNAKARAALQDGKGAVESQIRDFGDSSAREYEQARSGLAQRGLALVGEIEHVKADVSKRSDDVMKGLDEVKAAAQRQGRDYEQDLRGTTTEAREAAQKAGESIHQAGDSFQRAGQSVARVMQAADDEIRPHRTN